MQRTIEIRLVGHAVRLSAGIHLLGQVGRGGGRPVDLEDQPEEETEREGRQQADTGR